MRIEIRHRCDDFESYRAARVKSLFNCETGANFSLDADLPIERDDWRLGVVVGPSGSGKSSIGRTIWGASAVYQAAGWPDDAPIIDAIAADGAFDAATAALSAVGLGSVPAWLRPYAVLSTGERFRADLARVICDAPRRVVIDEFSSVVDRQIAHIGAGAFAKAWRRGDGQAVLLTCHYDVLDWLEPDWVFDTATGAFRAGRCLWRRPRIRLALYQTDWRHWPLFEPHHYLKLPRMIAAFNYVGVVDGKLVTHVAVSTRPGLREARACRLVVMPEWQGAGVGLRFLNAVCERWRRGRNPYDRPMPVLFHTSHPGLAAPPDLGPRTTVSTPLQGHRKSAWERASEADRDQARARLAAVHRVEELIAAGFPRLVADRDAAAEAGVSASALGAWRRKARGLAEGERVAALLDAPRTGRPSSIDAACLAELEALAHHHGEHLTVEHAQRTLKARLGRAPSGHAIRRFLARYRKERRRDLSAVTNPDRHRSHYKPAGGHADANIERLNQLWELDSTPADVMCADGKRYAIVGAIDVWSRRGRILVAPTSRADAIAALLRRCMLDWGVPEIVRTDEGRDYTSRHVLGVLQDLELAHDPCPPYTPEAKPFIERFLGTLARDLFAFLPGFAGHDVAGAAAIRARKSYAARRGEDDIETYGCALTAEELQARCDAWCEAVYERRPHDGLDGATPFARAASWTGEVRWVRGERALDALLAEPAGDGWRTVVKSGIRLDNVFYIAGPLGALVKERVRVRRDPTDPGRIHVYREGGTFVCVAEEPGPSWSAWLPALHHRTGGRIRPGRHGRRALEAAALRPPGEGAAGPYEARVGRSGG